MKFPDDFIDKVVLGDSLEVLKEIPDNSIDTIITDPPYGLEFMGKEWDKFKNGHNIAGGDTGRGTPYARSKPAPAFYQLSQSDLLAYQEFSYLWASEVLRVAKPGAILLAFGGTRTWHRLACGLEDAGWEIRDTLMWIYGSGFPKSLDISKAIDKMMGAEREVIGKGRSGSTAIWTQEGGMGNYDITVPATPEAKMWDGYGTALKPAYEPIILAMKPLDGTFAENALKWGVSGLNIDEARILTNDNLLRKNNVKGIWSKDTYEEPTITGSIQGRFPANLLLDEISAEMLDKQSGKRIGNGHWSKTKTTGFGKFGNGKSEYFGVGEKDKSFGGASRFFYVAKASRSERDAGLEELTTERKGMNFGGELDGRGNPVNIGSYKNSHPTVKPIKLMDYLVKLTKMPNPDQVYLDPFLGSGTTAIAVVLNGRHFIGIEKEQEYVEIAKARIEYWSSKVSQTFEFEEVENGGE